ncbi:MAG: hypothetical protein CMJ31_04750 [Phycisphaerae bacterium]|nr:hypothetical protein [Phycisphaerae bacterium]
MRVIGAAALAGAAGLAVAQPTVDGVLSASEVSFYGPIRWSQTVPTGFGDNSAGMFTGGDFGEPTEEVMTGIELCIPKTALDGATSFGLAGWVNSGDRTFLSNQLIHDGSLPIDTTNVGNGPIDWSMDSRFPGSEFVTVDSIPMGSATVDGTLDAGYALYFQQTNFTGFGDNGDATAQGGGGSEIDAVWAMQDANNIYLFVAGNLESNGNALDLYFDTVAGGATGLNSGSGDGGFIVNAQSGMVFDAGFTPDKVISIDAFDADMMGETPNVPRAWYGENTAANNFSFDLAGNLAGYGAANGGALVDGDAGAPAIQLGVDNSNILGVIGSPSLASPVSPDANWAYGSEIDNVRAALDLPNNRLYVFIGGNLQNNFNKSVWWFDAQPGGQNEARNDNPDIAFNGLNRHGPNPDDEMSTGLMFDDGFAADYWLDINNGVDGGTGNLINFVDAAVLRTDGAARFEDVLVDYGSFSGGDVTDATGAPVANPVELIDFDGGPNGDAIDGQDGTAEILQSQFAPRTSSDALFSALMMGDPENPLIGNPVPSLIQVSIDNSNVGGVTNDMAVASAVNAVNTGIEICIDLDELGWDGEQDILLAGWIVSGGFDFVSNQILGDAPSLAENDGDMNGIVDNLGEVRDIDFGDEVRFPGMQYVNLTAPVGPMGCNVADLAMPFGTLDIADVVTFLQRFGAMDPSADLSAPMGTFDIADVVTFLQVFGGGCPVAK